MRYLLAAVLPPLLIACGGGGGGGGADPPAAAILDATQPPEPPPTVAEVTAAAIHYLVERAGDRTILGRHGVPIVQTTSAPVTNSGIFDLFTAPFRLFGGGGGGSGGPDLGDYFPAGDNDQWTYRGDAEVLQGADPVLLFDLPATQHATWGFTLVATGAGLSFSDQEVAAGTISATPGQPLLWLANDLHVGRVHMAEGQLTYTSDDGTTHLAVHVQRTITLSEKGPHTTTYSYFSDALHFRVVDEVTTVPGDGAERVLIYDLYLGRGFGPVECRVTDNAGTIRRTEVERAVIGGHPRPDHDNDGVVNADDPDDDNDGVLDDGDGSGADGDHPCTTGTVACDDALPFDRNEQADADGDGIGNQADPDDDDDGVLDGIDVSPVDPTVSEAPYQVYLWVTDPADWSRRLYALDSRDGSATEIPAPDPVRPGELWDLAVYPGLPAPPTPRRLAFLAPGEGATPTDPKGSHLWAADEDGMRDLTRDLEVPLTGAVWRNDGEALYFTRGEHYPEPQMVIEEVDRLGLDAPEAVVSGPVWQPRFSPDQRFLAYANDTQPSDSPPTGLLLLDRQTGTLRNVSPNRTLGPALAYFDRTPEFSHDSRRLAVAGTRRPLHTDCFGFYSPDPPKTEIWVFDTGSGKAVHNVKPGDFGVGELELQLPQGYPALSPASHWLAVEVYPNPGADGYLAAVDLQSGRITTLAPSLPDPSTLATHWEKRAGGWSLLDPAVLVLPLTGSDGLDRPVRLTTDGAPPVALLPANHHSDGPILLSPQGHTVFFVEGETVWRVQADGHGLTPLTGSEFAGLNLRLEVAR